MGLKLSDTNKVKFYNYIVEYETNISHNFGHYSINSSIISFCEKHKILLGSDCKTNGNRIAQYKFYILWDDRKPDKYKNLKGNDTAHNLLRHLRNVMAHGNINCEKGRKFTLSDYNDNGRQTMRGKISSALLFDLMSCITQTLS